jgi:AcrR family transcriptional regulator
MPRAERELLILDVSGQVFARRGYHLASMDDIAQLAEVSKPMLYTYFGSKEGLYLAYIERAGGELLERLVGAKPTDGSPASMLRARITEFLSFVEEHRDGWQVLFRELGSTRPFAERVAELRERIAGAIRVMVQESVSACSGQPATAADAIAHALVGAGESLANWWLDNPEVSREQVAAWYFGVVEAVVSGASGT